MNKTKSDNTINLKDYDKITLIMDVLKRYDNYIISTNAKASLIIAFNSLILGIILLKFSNIISFYSSPSAKVVVGFLLVLTSASSLLSLLFIFLVVYPYFGSKSDEGKQKKSLIYFGSVSEMGGQGYFENLNKVTFEELIADLSGQASILASALKSKMLKMRRSIEAITFSLIIILFLIIGKALSFYF
jgi:hypothetical protein